MKTPSKPAPKPAPKPSTAVAKRPTESREVTKSSVTTSMLEQDAVQQRMTFERDDLAIPFLRVVQALSPQRKKGDAQQIDGAEEGDFYNTVTQDLWKGDEGVVVVPVSYTPSYIEWRSRDDGGGIVQDWGKDPSRLKDCTKDEKGRDITPEGHNVVRAGLYYALIVDPETGATTQVAISLSGSQLKKSRKWNTFIASLKVPHPETNEPFSPAPFYMAYRFTSIPEDNDQGSWMGVKIEPFQPVLELPRGADIYLEARNFKAMVEGGQVRAAVEHLSDTAAEPGKDDDSF